MIDKQQGEVLPEMTMVPTASSGVEGSFGGDVLLRMRSDGCKLTDVARKIVELGFAPLTEFHTLLPGYQPRVCIAQFSSASSKQGFLDVARKDTGAVAMFDIVRSIRTITCNRVPMQMEVAELEKLLFPPLLGKLEILKREKETCKDKDGKPLCYTGRVHFQVPTEEFERIRHVIPTSLPVVKHGTKYCVFVNFEGSQQRCHNCGEAGHTERHCTQQKPKQGAGTNDSVMVTGAGLPTSHLQSTPLKVPTSLLSPGKKRKMTESETEEKRGESNLKVIEEKSDENMELGKTLHLSENVGHTSNNEEEETESEDENELQIKDDQQLVDWIEEADRETVEKAMDRDLERSFGKGFLNSDRPPTQNKIEKPKFYVPGRMKQIMKVPKFLYAEGATDSEDKEEAPIGIVLALADRMKDNLETIWDYPKFLRFYYCEFTHDDRYPAWAEQHDYHFKL